MTWDSILENWMYLGERLCKDFPHLDLQALRRFRGDKAKLIDYLADTHHLTPSEAKETLADWMAYRASKSRGALAA